MDSVEMMLRIIYGTESDIFDETSNHLRSKLTSERIKVEVTLVCAVCRITLSRDGFAIGEPTRVLLTRFSCYRQIFWPIEFVACLLIDLPRRLIILLMFNNIILPRSNVCCYHSPMICHNISMSQIRQGR